MDMAGWQSCCLREGRKKGRGERGQYDMFPLSSGYMNTPYKSMEGGGETFEESKED